MAKYSISADLLSLELRQMGASKVNIHSSQNLLIQFDITDELSLSYFCNIRDEGKIFIQRIEPYPIRNYSFESVANILSFIRNDVELFANAVKSSNFSLFLDIINNNYFIRKDLEQLFLLNNVPHGLLEELLEDGKKILDKIRSTDTCYLSDNIKKFSGDYDAIVCDTAHSIDQEVSPSSNIALFDEDKE